MHKNYREKILVTIVLPVFNGERFLAQSIQSCLDQTYQNFELIIVNDDSKDNSLKIAKEFKQKDSRIRIISNPKNLKLPASLNVGHKAANGDFITWTSHDNIYEPEAIELLLKELLNSSSDIIYSNYSIIEENGNFRKKLNLQNFGSLLFGNSIGASFLYKKKVFEENNGYNESLHTVEDFDFWLRASLDFRIVHLEKCLYKFRSHKASLSSKLGKKNSKENFLFSENIKKSYYNFLMNFDFNKYEIRKFSGLLAKIHLFNEFDVLPIINEYNIFLNLLEKISGKSEIINFDKTKKDFDIRIRAAIQEYSNNQNTSVLKSILRNRPSLLWKYDRSNSIKIIGKCLK